MLDLPIIDLSLPEGSDRLAQLRQKLSLDSLLLSAGAHPSTPTTTVRMIIDEVRRHGDAAVARFAAQFDDAAITPFTLRVTPQAITAAVQGANPKLIAALDAAIENVSRFQAAMAGADPAPIAPLGSRAGSGARIGIRSLPLKRVGIYVPGGAGAYPSTLIMTAVPALTAGVKSICVCTPAKNGRVAPAVLVAASRLGINEIYAIGGAQAIAAMALGTATIGRVDKIVGPGNIYVQLAKKELFGVVDIDSFAGPSEVIVLADDSADARVVAAELLAQAEHAPGSCILLTADPIFAGKVHAQLAEQLALLPRRDLTQTALMHASAIVITESHKAAVALANDFAPEHLQISTRTAHDDAAAITTAGAIFIGPYSPVAAGDYLAGPSHVLPTSGTGRFFSGLSAESFRRRMSVVELDRDSLAAFMEPLCTLARAEGFEGHAKSAEIRLAEVEKP